MTQLFPERILHPAAAIAIEHVGRHHRLAAGFAGSLINAVTFGTIEIERRCIAFATSPFLRDQTSEGLRS